MIPKNPYALNLGLPDLPIDGCVEELGRRSESGGNTGSLKCWLTYRAVEGKLGFKDWIQRVRKIPVKESDPHMLARWLTSQSTSEAYLFLKNGDVPTSMLSALGAIIGWQNGNSVWSPQILNVLRCSCLISYNHYLESRPDEAIAAARRGIQLWKESVTSLVWEDWTLRFTEMRDDIVALQMLVFISGKCGIPITETKWMNSAICMPKERWSPFYELIIKMGEYNEKSRIWK